jgi:acetyl esterase/lipase
MLRGYEPSPELAEMRHLMDERAAAPDAGNVSQTIKDADGVEVWKFTPAEAPSDVALVHFHGGGYRLGSPKSFARYFARVAGALGATLYAPKYSLSPDAAFPAAIEDGLTTYKWLMAQGIPANRIIVGGDSAGGGLAAALLIRISELGLEKPGGVALFSPWLDLRVNAGSFDSNSATDLLFSRERANEASSLYLQGHDASDPTASPALADWTGQPPLLIQVSDIEVLRDDSLLLAASAAKAGVSVRLERFADTQHVWHTAFPDTPQTVRAVENWRNWLTRELQLPCATTPLAVAATILA